MPSNPKWLAKAKQMLAEGHSRGAIAKVCGVSTVRVSAVLIEHGLGAGVGGGPRRYNKRAGDAEPVVAEPVPDLPWPTGTHKLGRDPFGNLTERERAVIARAAPEAAMWAVMQARGLA